MEKSGAAVVKWVRRAAEHGNAEAQYSLGNMYITGRLVRQDSMEGLRWMAEAAAQGEERAAELLRLLRQG